MLRNRLIVLGLLILSVIAISFHGGPVTYGFFFLMLFIPLISAGYAYLEYVRHRIYQVIVTKNVVVGTPTEYYFTLQNEDSFSFSGIKVEFFSDFSYVADLDGNEYELPPHTGLKKETSLVCKYRGEYEVGIKNIIVQDYLRLFTFTFPNKENLRAIVNPRLEILDSLEHAYSTDVYKDSMINPTEQDVLVREYIPGDDIRNINWKASAHLGKPYIRTKTGEETQTVGIIMDSCRYNLDNPEEFLPLENKILETVLAVSYYYLTKGISVSVHTLDKVPRNHNLQSVANFEEFYSAMSSFSFSGDKTQDKLFEGVLRSNITGSSIVYMILHELSESAVMQINNLKRNGIPVVFYHINDKEEGINNLDIGKNTVYQRIGYEDRLKEVLK